MCQTSYQSNRVRVATEDITVWKLVIWRGADKCEASNRYRYFYKKGKTVKGEYQGRAFNDKIYRMKREVKGNTHRVGGEDIQLNGEGFHSFVNKVDARVLAVIFRERLAKFTIPKGARYIEGQDGSRRETRVSSKIRFEEYVKL